MKLLGIRKRLFLVLTVSFLLIGLSACLRLPDPENTIFVERPELFTRERLISQRQSNLQWLEKKIELEPELSFDGFREDKSTEGLLNFMSVKMDPVLGATQQNQLSDLQDQGSINSLRNEITKQTMRNNLASVIENGTTSTTNVGASPPAAQSSSGGAPAAPGLPGLGKLRGTNDAAGPPAVPTFENFKKSDVVRNPLDTLNDRLAYRNRLQDEMLENGLDDTHDLLGSSLYTFKFDVMLKPDRRTDAMGRVDVVVLEPEIGHDNPAIVSLYNQWKRAFEEDIQLQALALQQQIFSGSLPSHERIRILNGVTQSASRLRELFPKDFFNKNQEKAFVPFAGGRFTPSVKVNPRIQHHYANHFSKDEAAHFLSTANDLRRVLEENLPADKLDASDWPKVKRGICVYILAENMDLHDVILFDDIIEPEGNPNLNSFFLINLDDLPFGDGANDINIYLFDNFMNRLKKSYESGLPPYTYAVEPKEQAQTISDVAALERLNNYIFALQAIIPQYGLTGENTTDYYHRSQTRLQAIMRRPLIVGYGKDDNWLGTHEEKANFGWYFGPAYEIHDRKVAFNQRVAQHPVKASVVVPAWWHQVELEVITSWERGKFSRDLKTPLRAKVNVPPDYDALTQALRVATAAPSRNTMRPILIKDSQESKYIVIANSPDEQTLVLRGQGLWREPQVFIGNHLHSKFKVMSDLQGLYVTFGTIRKPVAGDWLADLRVVTSNGETVLEKAVKVIDAPTSSKPSIGELALSRPFIVNNSDITFTVNKPLAASYAGLYLRINNSYVALPAGSPVVVGDKVTFTKQVWALPDTEVEIDVLLQKKPDDLIENRVSVLPEKLKAFCFNQESDALIKLNAGQTVAFTGRDTNGSIQLTIPTPNTLRAYPGLEAKLKEGPGRAELRLVRQGGSNQVNLGLTYNPANRSLYVDAGELVKAADFLAPRRISDKYEFNAPAIIVQGASIPYPVADGIVSFTQTQNM